MNMNILLTGGAGFIGSNYLKMYVPKNKNHYICLDKLTYASNFNYIKDLYKFQNFTFIKGDIVDNHLVDSILKNYKIDIIINFAAETCVDKSFINPDLFYKTNFLGTYNLVTLAIKYKVKHFHQVSTDEVYGPLNLAYQGKGFIEKDKLNPTNPYSKSKAKAEEILIKSARNHLNYTITRSSNNYGDNQYPEKLIPLVIKYIKEGKEIPIFDNENFKRNYLFVNDHCLAIKKIISSNIKNQIYNLASNEEFSILEILNMISKTLNISYKTKLTKRKNHDPFYKIDTSKYLKDFGLISSTNLQSYLNTIK